MAQRILIAEDEPDIAHLEKDYLEAEGFEAVTEGTGKEGLFRAQTEAFDLVILDLMLPDMDGFSVCQTLRESSEVPILIVSARKEEEDKIYGLGLGADDYITKPFSPGELAARVRAHLARYDRLTGVGESAPEELLIRGLRVDRAQRRVFLDGEERTMTAKEYELLVFLMQHPNRVFSREELFREIWNLPAVGDSATVTVHINRLREKIEQDRDNPQYIETVWGVGYRFKI